MSEETENTEAAPAAEAAEPTETKNKKINKMSMAELDAAIKKSQEHMAGLTSSYAVALLARKKDLESAAG